MEKPHTVRIRGERWKEIEKRAWKLSQEADRYIKPTDVLDAALDQKIKNIEIEDIEAAKKRRK